MQDTHELRDITPASFEIITGKDGATVCALITTSYAMDAESLATKLHQRYAHTLLNGDWLEELTVEQVMQALADEAAGCADAMHFWSQEPDQESFDVVYPWAKRQIRRLFPTLTWPTSPEEMQEEWGEQKGAQTLVQQLTDLGVKSEVVPTGGNCWATRVVLSLEDGLYLDLTNPFGEGWSWQVLRSGEQALSGTWPEFSNVVDTASHVKSLITGLGSVRW
ncbi:hypothetical protein AB0O47_20030 [Streptomyces noursei]|uniref:hypothetical protein n=1 Tax=Streptomyces noursei TaxID=1971 RepID=UPI00344F7AA7